MYIYQQYTKRIWLELFYEEANNILKRKYFCEL